MPSGTFLGSSAPREKAAKKKKASKKGKGKKSPKAKPRAPVTPARQLPPPGGVPSGREIVRVAPKAKPRKPRKARPRIDPHIVAQAVEALERERFPIPSPIGPKGYRPTQCSAGSPPWDAGYREALTEAYERAALVAGDDEQAFREAVYDELARNPRFGEWAATMDGCIADYLAGHRPGKRVRETASRETRRRTERLEQGSAEHLDSLTLGGRAAYWRRLYKRTGAESAARKARELEAEIRRRKKSGPSTHRAG